MIKTSEPFEFGFSGIRLRIGVCLSVVMLGALILNPLFGSFSALTFLLFGALLLASNPVISVATLLKHWYLLLLPAYCVLSVLWSQFPSVTLRHGFQLLLTVVIAIVIARRITATDFVRCLFGIYSVGVVASLLFGEVRHDIGAWIGIFGSKNAFAAVVSVYILVSVSIMVDRRQVGALRLAALLGFLVSVPLLFLAQSTGAIVVMLPAVSFAFALVFSWRLRPTHRSLAIAALLLAGAATAMLLASYGDVLFATFLEHSGKDANLTGRTDLWAYGRFAISENPLLGLGYQAFWVKGHGPAEAFWTMFNIVGRSGFNFHNTYISNAVEIGVIGVSMQICILYGALFFAVVTAWKTANADMIFFSSFLLFVVFASFIEVAIFFQFSVTTVIVICSFIYGFEAWKDARSHARSKHSTYNQPHRFTA